MGREALLFCMKRLFWSYPKHVQSWVKEWAYCQVHRRHNNIASRELDQSSPTTSTCSDSGFLTPSPSLYLVLSTSSGIIWSEFGGVRGFLLGSRFRLRNNHGYWFTDCTVVAVNHWMHKQNKYAKAHGFGGVRVQPNSALLSKVPRDVWLVRSQI